MLFVLEPGEFTSLLRKWSEGDQNALQVLTPIVYEQLRNLARANLSRERHQVTLQPTVVLHEAYLKLVGHKQDRWHSRAHFFAMASRIMRQVLIEHARAQRSQKRGLGQRPISFEEAFGTAQDHQPATDQNEMVLALDDALGELAKMDQRKSRLVELKYFGGLTGNEIAEALDISPATVNRESRLAEAWLQRYLAT
jgi:RNA polymerase sigma factor (TIGR02999 family)